VGLCWQGKTSYKGDESRSPGIEPFLPLLAISNIRFFSLQKGDGREEIDRLGLQNVLVDFGPDFDDTSGAFVDTAAIMANLDLIVSSDTAVPHLAGALSRDVWVVLPFVPDWRWLLDREDSPWYPTMRLFRQPAPGDWKSVFERVASALRERTVGKN
jgi:hypothetical protein